LYRINDLWKIATKTEQDGVEDKDPIKHTFSKTNPTTQKQPHYENIERMQNDEFNLKKERVVANVGKAKSIKDLFN